MAAAWDAFISYARADSERTAIAVQRGLQRFARPWNQRRAVRVFRDDSAMSTNPALWSALEDGLAAAGHMIVLLSPAAATSAYVEKEVAWWVENKGPGAILLVLDAGELAWDLDGNRFTTDSAVPPCLCEAFEEEPRWLDLRWMQDSPAPAADPRFSAAMADLSAPIRGVPRDDLIGEDLTQHRRARRLAGSAVTLLVLLLVVSIVSTVLAVRQRDDVLRQAVTLRSRQLASTASGLLDSDLRLAQLLAVQGFRTEDSPATREALLQANFASPLVDRFTTFDADIAAISASGDGSTVAVALSDGRVYTVDGAGATRPLLRFTASTPVTALRVSEDGAVVLAGTRDGVAVSDRAGTRVLPGSADLVSPDAIALSPSGRRAAVVRNTATSSLVTYDTTTGTRIARRDDPLAPDPHLPIVYPQYTDHLAFLDDTTVRLVGIDSRWLELDLHSGRTSRAGSAAWAPYANLYATSSRADYRLSAPITDGQAVLAWKLDRAGTNPTPLTAGVQLTDPLGMAVSPDGRLVLVNDSSTGLSVAPVSSTTSSPVVPATRIAGLSGVTAMEFLAPARAVAAARTELAFLRFGGVGRGASGAELSPRGVGGVPEYAVDYRNSRLAVSPDGSRVAVLELNAATLEIIPVPGRGGAALPRTYLGDAADLLDSLYGVDWLDDDTVLVLGSQPGGIARGLPAGVVRWNLGLPEVGDEGDRQTPLAASPRAGGTVLVATSGGVVQTRATATAELRGEVEAGAPATQYDLARFSRDGRYLALIDTGNAEFVTGDEATIPAALRVVDSATGSVLHEQQWPEGSDVAGLEFAGATLLVSHKDGSVDVLPDLGRGTPALISTAGTRTSTGSSQGNPPVVGGDGLVGFPTRSGLQLYDLSTLQPSGALPAPPGLEAVPRTYAFAPDGHTLVTGFFGADARTARVSVRDLDTAAVVAQVCASAGGSISSTEWRRLVGETPQEEPGCR